MKLVEILGRNAEGGSEVRATRFPTLAQTSRDAQRCAGATPTGGSSPPHIEPLQGSFADMSVILRF